jgi:hypothetical protein
LTKARSQHSRPLGRFVFALPAAQRGQPACRGIFCRNGALVEGRHLPHDASEQISATAAFPYRSGADRRRVADCVPCRNSDAARGTGCARLSGRRVGSLPCFVRRPCARAEGFARCRSRCYARCDLRVQVPSKFQDPFGPIRYHSGSVPPIERAAQGVGTYGMECDGLSRKRTGWRRGGDFESDAFNQGMETIGRSASGASAGTAASAAVINRLARYTS